MIILFCRDDLCAKARLRAKSTQYIDNVNLSHLISESSKIWKCYGELACSKAEGKSAQQYGCYVSIQDYSVKLWSVWSEVFLLYVENLMGPKC